MFVKIDRRAFLMGAASLACQRKRGSGFDGYAFVANEAGRSVAAVDLTRFAVDRHIRLDASPTAVIAHPSRPLVYVLTPGIGTVHELELAGLNLRRRLRVAPQAHSLRLGADGRDLWVLCRETRMLIGVEVERFEARARIRLPAAPEDFDLSPRERRAAISFPAEDFIAIASLETAKIERTTRVGPGPRTVRFRSDGRQVISGNRGDRTLTIVDTATGRVVVHLPLAIQPENFCFKADGGGLYISGAGMDAIVSVYPYQSQVDATLLAGRSPGAMAATSAPPHTLFVANTESGDVTAFDIDTSKVIAVIQAGAEPCHIAVTGDNQYALVLNRRSGDMAVIRIPALRQRRGGKYVPPPLFTLIPVGSKPVSAAVKAL